MALESNRYWPFSWTNRAIYRAAARMFAQAYSQAPEIRAIYLRHTMASGDWTPGLSDIDISVILRADLEAGREFAFLSSFWERHERLKRTWPMLGEVDVLGEDELAVWMHYSARSAQPPEWRLLAGRDVAASIALSPPERWKIRALRTAFWFYVERFLPSLDGGAGFLEVKDRQRLARKILTLVAGAVEAGPPPAASDLETEAGQLLARVLRALDAATGPGPTMPAQGSPVGPCLPAPAEGVTSVVYESPGRTFVLIREGLGTEDVTEVRTACRKLPAAVFLTPAMFGFLVRHYEPRAYGYLAHGRAVACGVDPLPYYRPPSQEQFDGALLDRIPNLLQFSRSTEVIRGEASGEQLADQLLRFLPVSRALGEDAPELPFEPREHVAGREAFLLFRRLSAEVVRRAAKTVSRPPEAARR